MSRKIEFQEFSPKEGQEAATNHLNLSLVNLFYYFGKFDKNKNFICLVTVNYK